jgi:hypothetical protein
MDIEIQKYYDALEIEAGCSDEELRQAYRRLMLAHHPDKHPNAIDVATARTQRISEAYYLLVRNRATQETETEATGWGISFAIPERDILSGIRSTKAELRLAWQRYTEATDDPFAALKLIAAAATANRLRTVERLARDSTLIALAPALLQVLDGDRAADVLIAWSQLLTEVDEAGPAIQLLEDAFTESVGRNGHRPVPIGRDGETRESLPVRMRQLQERWEGQQQSVYKLKATLQDLHYRAAQGYLAPDGKRPSSPDRLRHLERLVALGRDFGYVHKLMAEAAHDLGDDELAKKHLTRAYELEPQLSGAVKISRALGFPVAQTPGDKQAPKASFRFREPGDIPPVRTVEKWAFNSEWEPLVEAATVSLYNPRILAKARATLRHGAYWLHRAGKERAETPLMLLCSCIYWDVRQAAMMSLARIGDSGTAKFLRRLPAESGNDVAMRQESLEFLNARMRWAVSVALSVETLEELQATGRHLDCAAASQVWLGRNSLEGEQGQRVALLHAGSSSALRMHEHSYHALKPMLGSLQDRLQEDAAAVIRDGIWSVAFGRPYEQELEEDYLLLTRTLFSRAAASDSIESCLASLHRITRWMEIIGDRQTGQWIRDLVRREAPGTGFANEHDRVNYVRAANWSPRFAEQHAHVVEPFKQRILAKLSALVDDRGLSE